MIGRTLAHFEITAKLGEGGMGEVFRARDTKLSRDVAIKILPAAMSEDPDRLARFEREARSLAALHHPNVASIFGFEHVDDVRFLVMEFVEGEDLAQRLERGPIAIDDATDIARQIAEGLEASHERTIVHRDLKPANVRITTEGQVKLLDFGLARDYKDEAGETSSASGGKSSANSPTMTAAMTQQGLILGTASYMSPEQARGKAVDHRADIWSFGVMLWEMLSGNRLFEGETTTDILANVLKHEIDFDAVPAGTPIALRRLLARCLQRDPRRRLHSIADARLELEEGDSLFPAEVLTTGADAAAATAGSRLPWALVGLLVLASALMMWRPWTTQSPQPTSPMAVSIEIPQEMEMNLIDWTAVATSNDGSAVAITARAEGQLTIQLRKLSEPGFKRLSPKGNAFGPFFSPDGRWVGYYSDGQLMKVSVDGGAPVELAGMSHPRGAVWGNDGYVYYAPGFSSGIHRRSESGTGEEEILTVVDSANQERTHRWPDVLPDGRGFVFTVGTTDSPGNYEDAEIGVYDARSKETRYLGVQGATARWSPSGHLLVMRNGVLHAVPLDLETLTLDGAPTPVFGGIRGDSASGVYYFAVNQRGDLYYVPAREGGPKRSLVWVGRDGSIDPVPLAPGQYRFPRIHPEGKLAALVRGEGHGSEDDEIHLLDLNDGSLTRFTFEKASYNPVWHPSGKSLFYSSIPGRIMAKELGGASGSRGVLDDLGLIALPGTIGSKGRILLNTVIGQATLGDLYALDLTDPSRLEPLIQTPAAEWGPDLSPDDKWVAYCSDETGREEIFVQPYPPTGAKWQVSNNGGRSPRWSHSGDELFFVEGHNFYAARVSTQPTFRHQTPEVLFEHRMDNSGVPLPNYDVAGDDQRFLIVEADAAAGSRQLRVVLGWLDGLGDAGR